MKNLGAPHLESFDYFISHGIQDCINHLTPLEFDLNNGEKISIQIEDCVITPPEVPTQMIGTATKKIYPTECRQRASTYNGVVSMTLGWSKNGDKQPSIDIDLGNIPLMVKVS